MTRHDHLLALFGSASSFVLLASCGAVTASPSGAADGGGPAPYVPDDPTPTSAPGGRDLCVFDRESRLGFGGIENVKWGPPPLDYVELRDQPYDEPGNGFDAGARLPIALDFTHGTRCDGAQQPSACNARYAAVRSNTPEGGWTGYSGGQMSRAKRFFVYTSGDEVGVATDIVGIRRIFGVIDTVEEAAVIAHLDGNRFDCSPQRTTTINAAPEGDGFRLDMIYSRDWTCPSTQERRVLHVDPQGIVTVRSSKPFSPTSVTCAGRRPEHFASSAAALEDASAARWLCEVAELEAASVFAFDRMARELVAFGAPSELVERCECARNDEVRHAETMTHHAKAYGGSPCAVALPALPVRSLYDVALENAVEGCVRESFGALVAHVQVARAATPALRESFVRIAVDETEHAALAHDCAAWLETRLTDSERDVVQAARRDAIVQLRTELTHGNDDPSNDWLGLPRRAESLTLLGLVERELARVA